MILFVVLMAWTAVYGDLIGFASVCQVGAVVDAGQSCAVALAYRATLAVTGLLVIESFGMQCYGSAMYGRVFARQRVFWLGNLTSASILISLIFNPGGGALYLVPVFAVGRLLLSPLIEAKRRKFSQVASKLRENRVGVFDVRRAVATSLGKLYDEQRTLQQVATSVNEREDRGGASYAWDETDLRRFLIEAEAALLGGSHGLPLPTVDSLLCGVIERLSLLGAPHEARFYGIFSTLASGICHLARSGCGHLTLFCVFSALDGCLGPLQARLISLLTTAIMEQDQSAASWQIPAYLCTYVLNVAINSVLVYAYSGLLAKSTAWLQFRLARKMLAMGSKEHDEYPTGSVSAMFASDVTRMQDLWTGLTWALMSPLSRVFIAVVYAVYVSPPVGVLALSVFPIIFITVPQKKSSSVATRHSTANSETISMFQNGVNCQRMLWSCDKQEDWLARYLKPLVLDQQRKHMSMRLWGGTVQAYVQQLVNLFVTVHIAILAWLAVSGSLTVAEFTGFVSLLSSLGAPSVNLGGFYRIAVTCAGSAWRVDEFLNTDGRSRSKSKSTVSTDPVATNADDWSDDPCPASAWARGVSPMTTGDLTLADISFQYAGSPEPALRRISLRISAGEFAGVVGGSGCGKSTLLNLMTTWLPPSRGSIRLGGAGGIELGPGCNLAVQARRLRKSISVVFQDTMLLHGTVFDNIAISCAGNTHVSQKDVEWAATAAGCADFIVNKLPDGYKTMLGGPEGISLSGGQAQRICIARALCRRPALLLLDEATSALDAETEAQIIKTIANLRHKFPQEFGALIVLSVTHHQDILRFADVIVHMSSGGIDRVEYKATPDQCHRTDSEPASA